MEIKLERIGIFGGTFNPPHLGHLHVAEACLSQLSLDKVIFVPAGIPPHRKIKGNASPELRLEMCKELIRDRADLEISRFEVEQSDVAYTVDTIEHFSQKFPDAKLFLIIGSDQAAVFNTWKSPARIGKLARIVIVQRNNTNLEVPVAVVSTAIHQESIVIKTLGPNVSSSLIRNRLSKGQSVHHLVPSGVISLLKSA